MKLQQCNAYREKTQEMAGGVPVWLELEVETRAQHRSGVGGLERLAMGGARATESERRGTRRQGLRNIRLQGEQQSLSTYPIALSYVVFSHSVLLILLQIHTEGKLIEMYIFIRRTPQDR